MEQKRGTLARVGVLGELREGIRSFGVGSLAGDSRTAAPVKWGSRVARVASSEGGRGLVLGGVPRGAASGATTNLLW